MALMLLLLQCGPLQGKGMEEMRSLAISFCSFRQSDYCKGTCLTPSSSNEEFFQTCFDRWKDFQSLSEETCEGWLKEIEEMIDLKIAQCMKDNHRSRYGECASFLAALGECRQSRGEEGAKEKLLAKYRGMYPRRRAFHGEMDKVR